MTILFILVCAGFTGAMLIKAASSLWGAREDAAVSTLLREDLKALEELVAERSMLLSALRELELDLDLEKISTEDYQHLKRRYEWQAVQIMRKLDERYGGRGWERAIDEAIEARLDEEPAPSRAVTRTLEPAPALLPPSALAPSAAPRLDWVCPACARVMDNEDMFCGRCGTSRPTQSADSDAPAEKTRSAERAQEEPATR